MKYTYKLYKGITRNILTNYSRELHEIYLQTIPGNYTKYTYKLFKGITRDILTNYSRELYGIYLQTNFV